MYFVTDYVFYDKDRNCWQSWLIDLDHVFRDEIEIVDLWMVGVF